MPLASPALTEFTTAKEKLISYSFTDAALQTGYITFYGLDGADDNYYLNNNAVASNEIAVVSGDMTSIPFAKVLDLDFDVEINKSMIVRGQVMITGAFSVKSGAGSGAEAYIIAKVRHYDGSTETDLVSITSDTRASVDTDFANANEQFTLIGDISQKIFKVGDTLRLTIELWGKKGSGTTNLTVIGHDPANRTYTGLTDRTSLIMYLPTRIDE